MCNISLLTDYLLPSQNGLCSTELGELQVKKAVGQECQHLAAAGRV